MTARHFTHRLLAEDAGAMTVEFVVIMLPFILIVFLAIETALALYWWKTAEKVTQLGARVAAVSDDASGSMPATNGLANGHFYGERCALSNGTCSGACTWPQDQVSCTGAACTGTGFSRILTRMQNMMSISASNVAISYRFRETAQNTCYGGYAGGPAVPLVTVTLTGVPFRTGFASMLNRFASIPALTTIPDISARITGEDLTTAGSP